ncbi:hypothetical protein F511_43646 [Dorcoceras hygrometricum]|uniref:Uncharacterized protein n=1 Tax=Dorcoceras hygrometricum TaxID=472368 RepID=A0A2Z7A0J3_9LAMI|nr:hypothetical protein F511_46423 [Dorcoceras hygrometricum]KZV29042.1 hypothetical protein F511_43646 [Dorcoceras hygrometricum]
MLTSSLLITAFSSRYADVVIADSRFLFTSTSGYCSSQLVPDFYCSSSSSNLSPASSEYHSCWSKLASAWLRTIDLTLDVSIANPAAD